MLFLRARSRAGGTRCVSSSAQPGQRAGRARAPRGPGALGAQRHLPAARGSAARALSWGAARWRGRSAPEARRCPAYRDMSCARLTARTGRLTHLTRTFHRHTQAI